MVDLVDGWLMNILFFLCFRLIWLIWLMRKEWTLRDSIIIHVSAKKYCALCANRVPKKHEKVTQLWKRCLYPSRQTKKTYFEMMERFLGLENIIISFVRV